MKKNSLMTGFITAFILFVLAPILVISILIGNSYRETILSNYNSQVDEAMSQLKVGIEDELKRVSLATSVVANDIDLMRMFESYRTTEDKSDRFDLSLLIDRQLDYLFSFSSDVNSLVVFYKDGSHFYYRTGPAVTYDEVRETDWYQQCMDEKGIVQQIGYGDNYSAKDVNDKTLAVAIKPKTVTIENSIELIYLDVFSPILDAIETETSSDSRYILCNRDRIIIADSESTTIGQTLKSLTGDDHWLEESGFVNRRMGDSYISKIDLNKHEWYLLQLAPVSAIDNDIRQLLMIFYIVYIVVAISFTAYIFVFYRGSIRPVRMLASKMKMVEEGNLSVEAEVTGPKEIKELGYTFNRMMNRINRLIEERDSKERERSAEEIKALQAQINPHFIHNTLNTIKLMAIMQKASTIREMLEAFMKVTELTFRSTSKHLTVAKEIDYLQSYVHIMQARYGSFVDVNYHINDEVNELLMMKMLLQPFIENAIVHGLQDMEDGRIDVTADLEDGSLVIVIEDNGVGMDQETINRMLKVSSDNRHIGLSNVKRRIELTYGQAYTVTVDSEIGVYTRVRLTLPVIHSNEEVDHVQGNDC